MIFGDHPSFLARLDEQVLEHGAKTNLRFGSKLQSLASGRVCRF